MDGHVVGTFGLAGVSWVRKQRRHVVVCVVVRLLPCIVGLYHIGWVGACYLCFSLDFGLVQFGVHVEVGVALLLWGPARPYAPRCKEWPSPEHNPHCCGVSAVGDGGAP